MRKHIKLIMSVLLIITMVTACGKSNKKGNETDQVTNANNTVAENTETTNSGKITNNQGSTNNHDTTTDDQQDVTKGVQQLFQVQFTAKKQATSQDITEYYKTAEGASKVSKTKTIPDDLTKLLLEKVNLADGEAVVEDMLKQNEISTEEFTKLTKADIEDTVSLTAIQADGDNDGIDDIIVMNFRGGTSGLCDLEFYKGTKDKSYTLTDLYNCVLTSFGVLNYEGKNYVVLKEFDYNTNYYNGYTLLLFDNGILADGKYISLEAEDYDMNIIQEDDSFAGIEEVKKTLSKKSYPSILENSEYVIYGNAEQQKKDSDFEYSCDIDNDGVDEYYNKNMSFPSSLGITMKLVYEFDSSNNLEGIDELLTRENEELYSFWIDKVGDKNVLYVYFGEDQDYTLYAYMIQR